MKIDKIMEEYIEMGNSYKQKEQELYDAIEVAFLKMKEFNNVSIKLDNNQEILKIVYQEELSEFSKSKLSMYSFDPFAKEEYNFKSLIEKFNEEKLNRLSNFETYFELINKVYINDKLSSNLPEKNKVGVKKI